MYLWYDRILQDMKKLILFFVPFLLAVLAFLGLLFYIDNNNKDGALQVTSTPKSKVYINDKLVGETPLCKCEGKDMLKPGQYTVRLVATQGDFLSYEEKVTINPSVLTVMDRTFGQGGFAESKTITLTKLDDKNDKAIELFVTSFPQGATLFIDNNQEGITPFSSKTISASDHELKIVKDGYKEKFIRIRTVPGYKLTVVASLSVLEDISSKATSSAAITSIPEDSLSEKVIILDTPTGFLRVRFEPSLGATEAARVTPGDTYELLGEEEGWFQILLEDGKTGWVSKQYSEKQ